MAVKSLQHAKDIQARRSQRGLRRLAASVRRWLRGQKLNYGAIGPDYKTEWKP